MIECRAKSELRKLHVDIQKQPWIGVAQFVGADAETVYVQITSTSSPSGLPI